VDANLLPTGKETACREAKEDSPSTRLVWVRLITHLNEISYPKELNRENQTDQDLNQIYQQKGGGGGRRRIRRRRRRRRRRVFICSLLSIKKHK
jgi:hypothetical protein